MRIDVINLSAAGDDPLTNQITAGRLQGKFVIIRGPSLIAIVFGSIEDFPYHANLTERFCEGRKLSCQWQTHPDKVSIKEEGYSIDGGGTVELDNRRKTVKFSGASKAYGPFSIENLKAVVDEHPQFLDFQVSIIA